VPKDLTENVTIEIDFSLKYTKTFPNFNVILDQIPVTLEFDQNLKNQSVHLSRDIPSGQHQIRVNYQATENVMTNVGIASIRFNGHSIDDNFIWNHSRFYPKEPVMYDGCMRDQISQYRHLGISGQWVFEFTTPLIQWFLLTDPLKSTVDLPCINKFTVFSGNQIMFVDPRDRTDKHRHLPKPAMLGFIQDIINESK